MSALESPAEQSELDSATSMAAERPRPRRRWRRTAGHIVTVLLCALVVGAAAYALSQTSVAASATTAEAVLVAPPRGVANLSGNPGVATQLASTYAAVIPRDQGVIARVARRTGDSTSVVRRYLKASRIGQGSAITLRYSASSTSKARSGLRAAVETVIRSEAVASIDPGTISVVSEPTTTPSTSASDRPAAAATLGVESADSPDPTNSNRLAANYAGLIPADAAITNYAARRAGLSDSGLRRGLKVSNDVNTSLIRLSLTNREYARARTGILSLVQALTGERPVSSAIPPASLKVVRLPAATVAQASSTPLVPIVGAVVGLLLGFALVFARRRRDPRIIDVDTGTELGIMVAQLPQTTSAFATLARSWERAGGREVRIVPLTGALEPVAQRFCNRLSHATDAGQTGSCEVASLADLAALGSPASTLTALIVDGRDSYLMLSERVTRAVESGASIDWLLLVAGDR